MARVNKIAFELFRVEDLLYKKFHQNLALIGLGTYNLSTETNPKLTSHCTKPNGFNCSQYLYLKSNSLTSKAASKIFKI
jgi:hypothetical protein